MSQSAVASEQVCLQQPFELSESVALLKFGWQRVPQAQSSRCRMPRLTYFGPC